MTVLDCIKKALKNLGLNKVLSQLETAGQTLPTELEPFLDMAQNIVAEICTDYYPLKITEVKQIPDGGTLMLSKLFEKPIDIFAVKKDGVSYPFSARYNRIESTVSGQCEIEYSFLPDISDYKAELPFSAKIGARIIGYGIAAEYCAINGLDDAVTWDKKYRDALKRAIAAKGEKHIKARAWL